jgi:hypothetical protein
MKEVKNGLKNIDQMRQSEPKIRTTSALAIAGLTEMLSAFCSLFDVVPG